MLLAGAILFAAATILYSVSWMYYIRARMPQVEIGIQESYTAAGMELDNIVPNSPAAAAGLKAGDRIVGINGNGAASAPSWNRLVLLTWLASRPGDTLVLTVQRPGQPAPLVLRPVFRPIQGAGDTKTFSRTVAQQIIDSYPILFVVVGLAVLFLRLHDPNAWLLAAVFATWIAPADIPNGFAAAPLALRAFLLAYLAILLSLLSGLFYFFFAVFPTRSPIDRRAPWLKWVLLGIGLCLGFGGIKNGHPEPLPFISTLLGKRLVRTLWIPVTYGAIFLGLLSLVSNFLSTTNLVERRKLKVILWGTAAIIPMVLVKLAENVTSFRSPFWLSFACVLLLFLFPLSFAYAVVKHRVMDIPVLLKRSARYFVVERGFVFLILVISVGATLALARVFSRHFSAISAAAIPIGATFGVLLLTGATQVHRRVRTRLDRAFFRSSYNAQQILGDLAAKTLTVSSREGLAELLDQNIRDALHPSSMFVYLDNSPVSTSPMRVTRLPTP